MKRKMILSALLFVLGSSCAPVRTSASLLTSQHFIAKTIKSEITLHSTDQIEYIYRYNFNGTLQYRRWNHTKEKWVDPYWIDAA